LWLDSFNRLICFWLWINFEISIFHAHGCCIRLFICLRHYGFFLIDCHRLFRFFFFEQLGLFFNQRLVRHLILALFSQTHTRRFVLLRQPRLVSHLTAGLLKFSLESCDLIICLFLMLLHIFLQSGELLFLKLGLLRLVLQLTLELVKLDLKFVDLRILLHLGFFKFLARFLVAVFKLIYRRLSLF